MNDSIDKFKKQHLDNYKNAVIELIKNNTRVLFENDINSLIVKPPLDSMDVIKVKFLDIAKKYKIILDTNELTSILDNYRDNLIKCLNKLKKERSDFLIKKIESCNLVKDNDLIKINKKDFNEVNKVIKKELKKCIIDVYSKNIVNNVNKLFTNKVENKDLDNIKNDIEKFLSNKYLKQLLDNIDIKILVKDTTLINLIKEQGERYLFTKNNSYIFK